MPSFLQVILVAVMSFLAACSDAADEQTTSAPCASSASLAWDTQVGTLFDQKCGSCHPGQQTTNYKTYSGVTSALTQVMARIDDNSMPPGGLDASSKSTIAAWKAAGAPQALCGK